jgi:hypothetical protein
MAASSPELDSELLTTRKEVVAVPKGIHTPMCYYGDNCKVVKCKALARLRDAVLHVRQLCA